MSQPPTPRVQVSDPQTDIRTSHWRERIQTAFTLKNLILYGSIAVLLWLSMSPLFMLLWGSVRSAGPGIPGAYYTLENYVRAFTEPFIYSVLWNTLIYAVGSTLLALCVGISLAWLVERTNIFFRNLIFVLLVIRIAVPQMMLAMSWILLLSPNIGLVNRMLEALTGIKGMLDIYSMGGMIWVQGVDAAPVVFLLATVAFRSLDPTFEEAAFMSGARLKTVLRYITIPLIIPALAAAILLVALHNLESFEVPTLIGLQARIQTFSSAIYYLTVGMDDQVPMASTYGMVFFVLAVLGLYFYQRLTAEGKKYMTITGKGYRPRRIDLGVWRLWLSFLVIGFLLFTYIVPILMLIWASLQPFYNVPSWEALARSTLKNYKFIWELRSTNQALRNSLFLGLVSATTVMFFTAVLAWVLVRTRSILSRLVDLAIFVPISFPGIVLGISLIWVYATIPIKIYGTIWILFVAYLTKYLSQGMRFSNAAAIQVHVELEEAAQVHGASWWQTIRMITFPLMGPGLLVGWLYVMVFAFREVPVSVLLSTPGSEVIAVEAFNLWQNGSIGPATAIGVSIVFVLGAIVGITRLLAGKAGVAVD